MSLRCPSVSQVGPYPRCELLDKHIGFHRSGSICWSDGIHVHASAPDPRDAQIATLTAQLTAAVCADCWCDRLHAAGAPKDAKCPPCLDVELREVRAKLATMTEAHAYEERRATSLREERDKCTHAAKLWQAREAALMEALTNIEFGLSTLVWTPEVHAEILNIARGALASPPASAPTAQEKP